MKYTSTKTIVSALTILSSLTISTTLTLAAAAPTPNTQAVRLAAIQTKADTDITDRLTSLSNLNSKVSAATKLSSAQKASLTTEMGGEISGLSTLKGKIDADTDIPTARTDFATIFSQHYIYALYLPRVNRIIAADAESDAVTAINSLAISLQGYIVQAKSSGNDVTALQNKLADMQAKTADAGNQSQTALGILLPLTASGYPGNKAAVQGTSTAIKTARTDLETARFDAKTIVASLKNMLSLK